MWTLQDAKNRFSAVVDAALAGHPQEVSRRGKPAVVVVAAEEFARLKTAARAGRGSFLDYLAGMPGASDDRGPDDWLTADRPTVAPRDVTF